MSYIMGPHINWEIQHPIQLIYYCAIEEKYFHCLQRNVNYYYKLIVQINYVGLEIDYSLCLSLLMRIVTIHRTKLQIHGAITIFLQSKLILFGWLASLTCCNGNW